MQVEQLKWSESNQWHGAVPELGAKANLVIVFGNKDLMARNNNVLLEIKKLYPNAIRIGCSTAGEIYDTQVQDGILSLAAIAFKDTKLQAKFIDVTSLDNSAAAGKSLAKALIADDLTHVFVLSDGLSVNGSELVSGLASELPKNASITGGLAGDGSDFKETLVYFDDTAKSKVVVAVGFYGNKLKVGCGSMGGWDAYGVVMNVTKSKNNVLYEIDNKPALDVYKLYLGEEKVKELPASALLFPLSLKGSDGKESVVRTILGIDEQAKSMTFAGDIPEGSNVQFMKANFNRLVEAAATAASKSSLSDNNQAADFAVLISCVGRKLILKQRIEEEVEAVRDTLGKKTLLTGFYSYGEISPFTPNAKCELHNQTMTITTFKEIE